MAITFSYDDGYDGIGPSSVFKVTADWTSDASGDAAGTMRKIAGTLVKAVTDPGDGPTDNYDITLTDEEGVNLLTACQSSLLNRHTTTTQEVYFLVLDAAGTPLAQSVHPVVCDKVTVTVAAAGNTKSGQLHLYFRR